MDRKIAKPSIANTIAHVMNNPILLLLILQLFMRKLLSGSYSAAIKLLCWFSLLFGGTYAFIGLNAPGGKWDISRYTNYFDYVTVYRNIVLDGAAFLLKSLGYTATREGLYTLRINHYNGIVLVYECLGIGVISFWLAFVLSDGETKWKLKWIWMIAGTAIISICNMLRIDMLLIAGLKGWQITGGVEHHTAYNWVLYAIMILLVFIYQYKKIKQ